jgi:hypothetical protein
MASLWFKTCYVEPILSGEKTVTFRLKKPKVDVGDTVSFHVGPKPAFATARVLSVRQVTLDSLPRKTQDSLRSLYDGLQMQLFGNGDSPRVWRIQFRVISS